ncbi:MAG: guanylate kinase [Candidatus Omnitrophica bacterium]|nr:guanylate kinase [Candidatus Omnitrophota bacterium]MBU4488061.1 guanylate kinase [Candidatus Omnitrophota bacterium]MCG2704852.1 guanylate kinase [Candidatus Omnitrophota bacterium]
MARKNGKLFIISAPSGSGKTTLCELLKKKVPRLARSVSVTTRPPRRGERNGRDYIFLTKKEFEKRKRSGGLLEWARNFGRYYGTPKERVLKLLKSGKDVILAIDVKGAMKVKRLYPGGVFVFIVPPSLHELKKRLKRRGTDGAKEIKKRIEIAQKEMSYLPMYNYAVTNESINKAVAKLEAIIKSERRKIRR